MMALSYTNMKVYLMIKMVHLVRMYAITYCWAVKLHVSQSQDQLNTLNKQTTTATNKATALLFMVASKNLSTIVKIMA